MKFMIFIMLFLGGLSMNTNGKEKSILASKVNIKNYEKFIEQLESDLPIGTTITEVKKQLEARGLEYSEAHSEAAFYIMIKKIRSRFLIFNTDLWIRIYFLDNHVSEVKSKLVRTAF